MPPACPVECHVPRYIRPRLCVTLRFTDSSHDVQPGEFGPFEFEAPPGCVSADVGE